MVKQSLLWRENQSWFSSKPFFANSCQYQYHLSTSNYAVNNFLIVFHAQRQGKFIELGVAHCKLQRYVFNDWILISNQNLFCQYKDYCQFWLMTILGFHQGDLFVRGDKRGAILLYNYCVLTRLITAVW